MPNPSEKCLAVLGLGPGATPDQIREAYRDLAKVWHPDRFSQDLRLRMKAEERLKEINGAYEALLSTAPAGHAGQDGMEPRRKSVRPAASGGSRSGPSARVKNRHVRMPLPRVQVRFGDRLGRLTNLSVTGGQLLLDEVPSVGTETTLRLQVQRDSLDLRARVIRVNPVARLDRDADACPQWSVSVAFVGLPPQLQRAIPRFYTLLLEASRGSSWSS